MRDAQVGYNHNVRYRARVYHVQTEDAGVAHQRVDTHLFYRGTIIASVCEGYGEADGDAVQAMMRAQHKAMMKRLLRGELDTRIVAQLGVLAGNAPTGDTPLLAKLRSYRHSIGYAGRTYSVQTDFYATVVTDVFHETVFIGGERQDLHGSMPPGSDGVTMTAQEQHKRVIRALRGGDYDERITALFGALSPRKRFRPSTAQVAALLGVVGDGEPGDDSGDGDAPGRACDNGSSATFVVRHRLRRDELSFDVVTEMHGADMPKIITSVSLHDTLLTSQTTDYGEIVGTPESEQRARALATAQHKRLLEDLRRGELDETVALLEEMRQAE